MATSGPAAHDRQPATDKAGQPENEKTERPWYRRPLVVAGLVVAAVVLVIGGVVWWLHARRYESTDDAFIDVHFVRLSPRVSGRVLDVPVTDNQAVAAGQVVTRLDPADFRVALDQAQARLAEAEGQRAQAEASRTVSAATVEQAQAEVQVAEANAANAQADLDRYRALARGAPSAVSQQQMDNVVAAARTASAQLNSARKKLAAQQAQVDAAASQITSAEAQVRSARAQVEQARLNLSYTQVAAPLAGHVTHLTATPGTYVEAGQDLMAVVPSDVWVTANFKETQLTRMRPGQPVDIEIDAYPDLALHGHVESIQRGSGPAFSLLPPQNATGNYVKVVQRVPVKIRIDDPIPADHPVGPGLSVVPTVTVR